MKKPTDSIFDNKSFNIQIFIKNVLIIFLYEMELDQLHVDGIKWNV